MKKKVLLKGGPLDGELREMTISDRTGLPGPMGCITDAHARGMHGGYNVDRTVKEEPFVLRWCDRPRGNERACHCGCGGRL